MRRGVDYVSSDRDRISGLVTYSDETMGVYVLGVQYQPWRSRTWAKPLSRCRPPPLEDRLSF